MRASSCAHVSLSCLDVLLHTFVTCRPVAAVWMTQLFGFGAPPKQEAAETKDNERQPFARFTVAKTGNWCYLAIGLGVILYHRCSITGAADTECLCCSHQANNARQRRASEASWRTLRLAGAVSVSNMVSAASVMHRVGLQP